MTIFDVQTSYGGLKVSEFNQEFNSEVKKNMTYFGQKKIVWNYKLYQEAFEA